MIAKKIHFFWIGDETQRPQSTIDGWQKKHPDFEIKIWGNASLGEHRWQNAELMEHWLDIDLNIVMDIMRWEILETEGGIAVECHTPCMRRTEDWLLDLQGFACWDDENKLGTDVVGLEKNHPMAGKIIEKIQDADPNTNIFHQIYYNEYINDIYTLPRSYFSSHKKNIQTQLKELRISITQKTKSKKIASAIAEVIESPLDLIEKTIAISELTSYKNGKYKSQTTSILKKLAETNNPLKKYTIAVILESTKDKDQAIPIYNQILEKNFHLASAKNKAKNLICNQNYKEALDTLNQIINNNQQNAEIFDERGLTHYHLNQSELAIQDFIQSIKINPNNAATYQHLAEALKKIKLFQRAAENYEKALKISPNNTYLMGQIVHAYHHACFWNNHQENNNYLIDLIRKHATTESPFAFINITDSAADQLTCANLVNKSIRQTKKNHKVNRKNQIKLGYLSGDYRKHATMYLMENLFNHHDREKFEVIGISVAPERNDQTTNFIKEKFDQYIEFSKNFSDKEIAEELEKLDIDILIDLKGYTEDARPKVFGHHPCPIQVNYLGYPGTMGGTMFDYIIADEQIIPEALRIFYTEKVVTLPFSYQINNNQRPLATDKKTRTEHGLPETGFVFCCFNNNYKINPSMFSIWMRLLQSVPQSVLWLLAANPDAERNLKRYAEQHGVHPDRLVFAPRAPQEQHLGRQQHADLFLDTHPVNAHTTTSDALWAGLPVLTYCGEAFAARVAASLLRSAGLPELITHDLASYEAKALFLAQQPEELRRMKQHLQQHRFDCDLFNTEQTTRGLEAAYLAMYQRHLQGLPPDHIQIARSHLAPSQTATENFSNHP